MTKMPFMWYWIINSTICAFFSLKHLVCYLPQLPCYSKLAVSYITAVKGAQIHMFFCITLKCSTRLEAIQRWLAICRVWPWTLTYQKFLLCISSRGQDLYSHQKFNMYIYWFSSESVTDADNAGCHSTTTRGDILGRHVAKKAVLKSSDTTSGRLLTLQHCIFTQTS